MAKNESKAVGAPGSEPIPTEEKWLGIAKMSTGEIVSVLITDLSGTNMPFGRTDWLEAIEGESEAIAMIKHNDGPAPVTVDCGSDAEAPVFYHHYD